VWAWSQHFRGGRGEDVDRSQAQPKKKSVTGMNAERGPRSPAAQAAAALLLALSRAARSFILYEPGNAIVRQFLEDYQAKARGAVDEHGELNIEVRPFEMLVQGEVVYRDQDREKSLAFKLFRDGVRRLSLLRLVTFEELLKLLEILAVRYAGVRQQEEDTLTLLRKAEFGGITIVGVEGFAPAEESPEPALDAPVENVERARHLQPPAGFDTPLPKLSSPGPLHYREVAQELLLPIRAEAGGGTMAELAVSLVRDLIQEGARAGWPTNDPELLGFLAEVRDGLLAERDLASLRRLIDLLGEVGGAEMRQETLRSLGDAHTLDLILESVREDAARLPPDLVPLLPLVGIDAALERLGANPSEARRRLLTQVVLARLPREADVVLTRLPAFDPRIARDLGRGIVGRAPERAVEVARQFLAQSDEELRLEGLAALESAPGEIPLRPVRELLGDASESVRVRAAEVLGCRGDESVIDALKAALQGGRAIPPREAEAIGQALARAAPIAASRVFADWIAPRARFLRGLSAEQRACQWAAVAGMGLLPGSPEQVLGALAERSEGELRRHCLATLARWRKGTDAGRE